MNPDNEQWNLVTHHMPTYNDFGVGFDEAVAFKRFGGLTLDAAYARFLEQPDLAQEDFMFMGGVAFLYYFPVVERFVRSFKLRDQCDGSHAWIIARGFLLQLSQTVVGRNRNVLLRIAQLADIVLSHLHHYAHTEDEQMLIMEAWEEVRLRVLELQETADAGE